MRASIPTSDNRELSAQLFLPEHEDTTLPAVVIHPATGVHKGLYAACAQYLADHGIPVLTYDYRGTNESALPSDYKDKNIGMSDWMLCDVPAANRFLRSRYPDRKIVAIGHSVGGHGQLVSFQDEPVDAIALVASHAGITRLIPPLPERLKVGFVFNVFTPLTARFLGYVPVDKIGMGKPVPAGIMLQWRHWTRMPQYFFDDPNFPDQGTPLPQRFAKVTAPVLSIVLNDDPWATREASDVLLRRLTGASVEKRDISPASIGAKEIGHMGFFRSKSKDLWEGLYEWVVKAT
ncbi:alpha/beta hydrolase family protein [Corynebacterium lowii]|nr:alpha/beta fold hydrolase [Corynebacterium lowii]MDP9852709.1 putative alpha/beta hydrolase [Corynebacterium lowii]